MNVNEKLNLSLDDLITLKRRSSSSQTIFNRPSTVSVTPAPRSRPSFRPFRRGNAQGNAARASSRTTHTVGHPYAKAPSVAKAEKLSNNRFSTNGSPGIHKEIESENENKNSDLFMIYRTCLITVSGVQGLSEASIRKIFQMCGTVLRVRLATAETALVDLDAQSVQYPTIEMLDGYDIDGAKLRIDSIVPQSVALPKRASKLIGNGSFRHAEPYSTHRYDENQSSQPTTIETSNITMSENIAGHVTASIIVSNIPINLIAQDVQEAFSVVGTIKKSELLLNSNGEHTGRAAIVYEDIRAAEEAVRRFDGGDLNNKTIRVFLE